MGSNCLYRIGLHYKEKIKEIVNGVIYYDFYIDNMCFTPPSFFSNAMFALFFLKRAALSGHKDAMYELGHMLLYSSSLSVYRSSFGKILLHLYDKIPRKTDGNVAYEVGVYFIQKSGRGFADINDWERRRKPLEKKPIERIEREYKREITPLVKKKKQVFIHGYNTTGFDPWLKIYTDAGITVDEDDYRVTKFNKKTYLD